MVTTGNLNDYCALAFLYVIEGFLILYLVVRIIKAARRSVTNQIPSSPAIPAVIDPYTPDYREQDEDEEDKILTPLVGQTYPLEGDSSAKLRVDEVDEDSEEIRTTLLIELAHDCEIKAVQRGWDGYGESLFVCVTYAQNGVWKTRTLYLRNGVLPEFDSGEVFLDEVEVSITAF